MMIRDVFLFLSVIAIISLESTTAFFGPPLVGRTSSTYSTDCVLLATSKNDDNNNKRSSSSSSWEDRWNEMYDKLVAYKETFGDTDVPFHFHDDPKLTNWVAIQRENLRRDAMRQDRQEKLAGIGLTASTFVGAGDATMVVSSEEEDADTTFLSTPTTTTKTTTKEESVTKDSSSSSSWEKRWDDMYDKLQVFYDETGTTNVTKKDDAKLANWVSIQRENLQRDVMREDRIVKLKDIGIV